MKILYLLHAPFETPGFIESWAAAKGYEQVYSSPYAGETIPKLSFDLIIAMGGPQSSLDLNKHPYLKDEINLIHSALKAKIPVLGFCLGAQLLGEALGAPAERSPFKEIGIFPLSLTDEGLSDPLLTDLPKTLPIFHWHSDMPGLTKESTILAASEGCPRQIIRYLPHAYGFQCHPEMTLQGAAELIKNCPNDFTRDKYIQTPQDILAHDFHALNHEHITRILDNFLALLAKDQAHLSISCCNTALSE